LLLNAKENGQKDSFATTSSRAERKLRELTNSLVFNWRFSSSPHALLKQKFMDLLLLRCVEHGSYIMLRT